MLDRRGGPLVILRSPDIRANTDVVVRGIIGGGGAQLSADEHNITTTYDITNPKVAFPATPPQLGRPGVTPRALTVTLLGGTVPIGRFTATVHYHETPTVTRGMDVIALLWDRNGTYTPAGGAGVFEVREGRIAPLSGERGEQQKFRGMAADDFVSQIVTLRKNISWK